MAANWTEEQLKVINLRERNILVSAAAGSGKTAVLVERIIKMVTDEERNIDIDRLIVVTFTKAAAGEMKQRISDAIEHIIEQNPEDVRLQKQLTLINNAQITTIDSFCLNIIRNNFATADIDPGFRTADEGEIKLIESDVMGDILEEYYQSEREDFFDLVNSYGNGKSDSELEEIIYRVYNFSRSYPWPLEWLEECRKSYQIDSESELNENRAVEYLTDYVKNMLSDYYTKYEKILAMCSEQDGPYMYKPMIENDYTNLTYIMSKNSFEELADAIHNVKFDRMSSKKDEQVDEDKKEIVKNVRNKYKKTITDLQKKIFRQSMKQNLEDLTVNITSINTLLELVQRFYLDMKRVKREKNIIDFNDMEHLALDILVQKQDGNLKYTDVADRLSEFYEEVLIDEYQDSNLLQEQILYSIGKGRKDENKNNIFMVGDVKQSIYKFRLARPDLFISKYNHYTETESKNQKIELRKNFRSRDNVLKSINDIFFRIMKSYFGGIEYNENVMLNTGLDFKKPNDEDADRIANTTDICIVSTEDIENQENNQNYKNGDTKDLENASEEDLEKSERELEAIFIAAKIKEMTEPESGLKVFDKKLEEYRVLELRDIVILTRTVSGWADTFVNVLMSNGIPAYSDSSSGYFNTREVKLILSFLAVVDNPIQDIPLAAVMTSYFGKLTTEELALIRISDKKQKLYYTLINYDQNQDLSNETKEKIRLFLELILKFRDLAVYVDIHELIWKAIYDTGFYAYVGSMPSGKKRQANLDVLIEKAKKYESTSYKGLFNFLRYIGKLKKYDIDYGEASLLGENENLVKVVSIHKSKGLEFPVVFLAGMSKRFNNMDAMKSVVVDPELGIAGNSINLENRTKIPTIIKTSISTKIRIDNLCEELRILYVAMTRAKEKLIMTGTVKNLDKSLDSWKCTSADIQEAGRSYSFADLESCSNYFDLVVPTTLQECENSGKFLVQTYHPSDFVRDSYSNELRENETVKQERNQQGENTQDKTINDSTKCMQPYPFQDAVSMKGKMTVSELKKSQLDSARDIEDVVLESEFEDSLEAILRRSQVEDDLSDERQENPEIVPQFISGEKKMIGSDRGTAYHRVMECMDYHCSRNIDELKEFLLKLVIKKKISQQQLDAVDVNKIWKFCQSGIGQRIVEQYTKSLKREQPFVFGTVVNGEQVLIQGVIDLFFEENSKIILVDYKTDNVKSEEILKERYQIQLQYYADALEMITGKKVTEKIIYSFKLNKEILLEESESKVD